MIKLLRAHIIKMTYFKCFVSQGKVFAVRSSLNFFSYLPKSSKIYWN